MLFLSLLHTGRDKILRGKAKAFIYLLFCCIKVVKFKQMESKNI